ncbi:MAG: 5-(carboxyamino)imidazole ribonucleotide mutase [Armatimonadetes bacterium]|nr:5-(carboxyamino)imidazole ribonucleotide mutase [Armatimonadota bacterium]
MTDSVVVGIVMGSSSDEEVMRPCRELLAELGIGCEVRIASAHRTPDVVADYASSAADRGLRVIIAGAGAAAALPGVIAAHTHLPVIGVPIDATPLHGVDALYSMVQMPSGIPVATVSINGAKNAAVLAARILATSDPELGERLAEMSRADYQRVMAADEKLREAD